ncbi:MAG: hypothetical protein M1833_002615 [Piccolia ochrophora]|nr:MAG: hypothetical protein M1833_002615 [Piccolia ochrophora]
MPPADPLRTRFLNLQNRPSSPSTPSHPSPPTPSSTLALPTSDQDPASSTHDLPLPPTADPPSQKPEPQPQKREDVDSLTARFRSLGTSSSKAGVIGAERLHASPPSPSTDATRPNDRDAVLDTLARDLLDESNDAPDDAQGVYNALSDLKAGANHSAGEADPATGGAEDRQDFVPDEPAPPGSEEAEMQEMVRLLREAERTLGAAGSTESRGPRRGGKKRTRRRRKGADGSRDGDGEEYVSGVGEGASENVEEEEEKEEDDTDETDEEQVAKILRELPSRSHSPPSHSRSPSGSGKSSLSHPSKRPPSPPASETQPLFPSVPTTLPSSGPAPSRHSPDEIDRWCVICCADATLRCWGGDVSDGNGCSCEGERFCGRCWGEGHAGMKGGLTRVEKIETGGGNGV